MSIFSLAAGTSYNLLLYFPPFLFFLWPHHGRKFFRIKVPRTVWRLYFHLVCGSTCQCWGSTQALVPAQTLLQHFCLQPALSDTCGIYLFSTANAGSNAHLINLNQSYRKALVLHNDKLHQKHITLITGLQRLQHGELRLPTTALLHFITRFCGKHLQICCWIQKFRKSGSRLEILRYPISPPISQELHSVCNHFSGCGVDWETKWKELLVCVPLICTLQRLNWH